MNGTSQGKRDCIDGESSLDCPGGSNVITISLKEGQRSERRCDFRSRGQRTSLEEALLLVLKMEDGGTSQGMPVARKGKETEPLLEPPEGT